MCCTPLHVWHPTHTGMWISVPSSSLSSPLLGGPADLIMVSAGFDAHRKDDINFRYIGATEDDFEWLTDQIVQVANK